MSFCLCVLYSGRSTVHAETPSSRICDKRFFHCGPYYFTALAPLYCCMTDSIAPVPPPPPNAAGSGCNFEYTKQPPSTALNGCNPYQVGTNTILIVFECVVRRSAMIDNKYEVRWFRENTTGAVEDLGLGDPNIPQGMLDWFSRYHDTALIHRPYSPSLLGKYWCQVINTTADPDQPLMRSNVFTLLAPGDYSTSGSVCGIQAEANIACADLPDSQPVQTTTQLLSTTSKISVLSTTTSTTVRLSDNIFTLYNTGQLCNIYTMASKLISAISDPRPRYQPEAKPRADIEGEGLILLILT